MNVLIVYAHPNPRSFNRAILEAVDATLRELIIERAMPLPDDPIDFEEFKIIVLMVLWCRETPLDPLIVDELISAEPPQYLH